MPSNNFLLFIYQNQWSDWHVKDARENKTEKECSPESQKAENLGMEEE